jgi:exopolysaccharide biosynthesis protein
MGQRSWHQRWLVFCGVLLVSIYSVPAEQFAVPDLREIAWERHELAPGVQLKQHRFADLFGAPQVISVVAVETERTNVQLRFAAAHQHGRLAMTVAELGQQTGALLAVNGGFFGEDKTANSGILKIDGAILPFTKQEPPELHFVGSSAVGVDWDGHWHFILRPGPRWADDWEEMRHALAGGHALICEGKIYPEIQRAHYESARESAHVLSRHPRTAIGARTNRVILLVTADGRHPKQAEGLTLLQTALLMKSLGCVNAINLDGGGSTTLWRRGKGVINHPSDNKKFDAEGARLIRTAVIVNVKTEDVPSREKPELLRGPQR